MNFNINKDPSRKLKWDNCGWQYKIHVPKPSKIKLNKEDSKMKSTISYDLIIVQNENLTNCTPCIIPKINYLFCSLVTNAFFFFLCISNFILIPHLDRVSFHNSLNSQCAWSWSCRPIIQKYPLVLK